MDKVLRLLGYISDIMTVLGLSGLFTYGIFTRKRNLIGHRVFKFTMITFKFGIMLIVAFLFYLIFIQIYSLLIIMLKGNPTSFFWEKGEEILHIIAYLPGVILLSLLLLTILSIWTSSFYYPKRALAILSGGKIKFNFKKYENLTYLEIIEASYETDQHSIDVTQRLRSMIDGGKLSVLVSNSLGGDPHYGVPKRLKLKYRINENENTITAREDQILEIP